MGRVLFFLVAAVVLFAAGSGWIALYPPVRRDLGGVEDLDARAEKVRIPVGPDDTLDGWLLAGRRDALIVIFHGYGREHTRAWRYAQFLQRGGYGILTVDFRSSRSSNRKPTTLGAYELEDARAVLDWIRTRRDLRHQSLGLFGESLGGSVALVAAAGDSAVQVVVVDGAFATGRRALEEASMRWAHLPAWPSALLARALGRVFTGHDPYALDAEAAARALAGRHTLFIAAENDPRFSEAQARSMWRAAGSDPGGLWVLRGPIGHNEGWIKDRAEYERRVLGFYERNLAPAVAATAVPAKPGAGKSRVARGATKVAR
jgi:pimeloyl-ACP methyl ester carboxylesterase